jgi:hypothetical protein
MDNDTRGLPNFDIQAAEQSLRLIDRTLIGSKINYKRINLLMAGVKSVIRDRRSTIGWSPYGVSCCRSASASIERDMLAEHILNSKKADFDRQISSITTKTRSSIYCARSRRAYPYPRNGRRRLRATWPTLGRAEA